MSLALEPRPGRLGFRGELVCQFTVNEPPRGKQAPRHRVMRTRSGREFVVAYTAAETRAYEKLLAQIAAMHMRGRKPEELPVAVEVTAYLPVPSSWAGSKRDAALAGAIVPNVKPDWDNIGKTLDALKGIVWLDDKQIAEACVRKLYAENPRLEVSVWRIG